MGFFGSIIGAMEKFNRNDDFKKAMEDVEYAVRTGTSSEKIKNYIVNSKKQNVIYALAFYKIYKDHPGSRLNGDSIIDIMKQARLFHQENKSRWDELLEKPASSGEVFKLANEVWAKKPTLMSWEK